MISLAGIQATYPKTRKNRALTGFIPIATFNQYEEEIRLVCKQEGGLRVFYRGPRHRVNATRTRRADATHAVIYYALR